MLSDYGDEHLSVLDQPVETAIFFQFCRGTGIETKVSRQLADGNSWRKMEFGARPYATVADACPGHFRRFCEKIRHREMEE
jgi:hypothetical protein